jgi:hypothetical protein
VIAEPVNDRVCLAKVTDVAERGMDRPKVRQLAERFDTTYDLAQWIRSLPQRNDEGAKKDGPRIACPEVTQRVRLLPGDPNCVERSILYVAAAEHIDDKPVRQLATIETKGGLHTFPVEDGDPVKLDPVVTRNAMRAGLDMIRNAAIPSHPVDLLQWVVDVAHEPAAAAGQLGRLRNAAEAMTDAIAGAKLRNVDDLGMTFALAEQAARLWGGQGVDAVRLALLGLQRLAARNAAHRNVTLRFSRKPVNAFVGTLGAVGRVGSRVAMRAGSLALRAKLASMGIAPQAIDELEQELQHEGRTLGPLAQPQKPGALDTLLLQGVS